MNCRCLRYVRIITCTYTSYVRMLKGMYSLVFALIIQYLYTNMLSINIYNMQTFLGPSGYSREWALIILFCHKGFDATLFRC